MSVTHPTGNPGSPVEKIEKKLRLAGDLFRMAFEMKRFQLRTRFPGLSPRELNRRAYQLIENGCR